jgi:hypothetical protein
MFANVAQVRPFNFTNAAEEAATANFNIGVGLVNGKNARGRPLRIQANDPRKAAEFAEAMGTNIATLEASMAANQASRNAGVTAFKNAHRTMNIFRHVPLETIVHHNPNHPIFLNTPTKNLLRSLPQEPIGIPDDIQLRDMAEQYGFHRLFEELKYLENLELEGYSEDEIAEIRRQLLEAHPEIKNEIGALIKEYQRQAHITASEAMARRSAGINAHTAMLLNDTNLGGGRRKTRRRSHRSRK